MKLEEKIEKTKRERENRKEKKKREKQKIEKRKNNLLEIGEDRKKRKIRGASENW